MRKYVLIVLPLVILVGGFFAVWFFQPKPEPERPTDKTITWGMTQGEVKARANAILKIETGNTLLYDTPEKTTTEYHFRENALYAVTHRSQEYGSFEECLQEYQELQKFLRQKYGQPQEGVSGKYQQSRWEVPVANTKVLLLVVNESPYQWIVEFSQRGEES